MTLPDIWLRRRKGRGLSEASYILDGLLMNETGHKIKEQYADTGGFTDHVFAVTALLAYRFIPRIRDLPSKRLYVFDPRQRPEGADRWQSQGRHDYD